MAPIRGKVLDALSRLWRRAYYIYQPKELNTLGREENVRPVYRALLSKKSTFTYEEMQNFRKAYGMNSYEQDALVLRLDVDGLIKWAEHLYKVGDIYEKPHLSDTYSDNIVSRVTPLLIRALKRERAKQ